MGIVGYFRNGFVFSSAPDFGALASSLPTFCIRGYQHRSQPLWLLDIWEKPKRGEHFPFAITSNVKSLVAATVVPGSQVVIDRLSAIEKALKNELDVYGAAEVRATVTISSLTAQRVLYFKADDDLFDFACLADQLVQRAQYRLGPLKIDVDNGRIGVEPLNEEDGEPVEEFVEALKDVEGIEIRDSVELEDGLPLYGSVLAVWPKEFPRAEESLGLGTWDPLEHLDRDLTVVFERLVG